MKYSHFTSIPFRYDGLDCLAVVWLNLSTKGLSVSYTSAEPGQIRVTAYLRRTLYELAETHGLKLELF